MLNEICSVSDCEVELNIAESKKEAEKNKDTVSEFWTIEFSYKTFFFCSPEHSDEYAN